MIEGRELEQSGAAWQRGYSRSFLLGRGLDILETTLLFSGWDGVVDGVWMVWVAWSV